MKKVLIFVAILVAAAALVFLINKNKGVDIKNNDGSKSSVVVSFYPLQYLAERIGGDRVNVSSIVPGGVEPHDYEPTTDDLKKIQNSEALFIVGGGVEPWASEIKDNKIVLGEKYMKNGDVHVWLDPLMYTQMATDMANDLKVSDRGIQSLVSDLNQLDSDFRNGLKLCDRRMLVTAHKSFGYLADRYGLESVEVSGLSPEEEPSPQRIAEVVKKIKESGAMYIFAEAGINKKLVETVARETDAKILELDPLETKFTDGDYLSRMRKNLDSLRTGLGCK